ncbi:tetratricopeptide repeat protein [uncultured Capnocytophaga sp.]|uniref:tetratricopeptide repeat protein n=1 Tax=uncultured Capnocytophaga sp. TaxID=159273 RepID=UPI0026026AA6|nr:tetratricopeptide repeat protein [uncultured Capnocytophaga sp.]
MSVYKKNNYRPGRQTKKERQQEEAANEVSSEQLSHESTTAEVFDTLDEKAGKTEAWVIQHQRTILFTIVAVVVVGLGYMFYKQFVSEPREREISEQLSFAQSVFNQALDANTTATRDSLFTLSLNGDKTHAGFLKIIKDHGSSKAGNVANYAAGMAYLQLNKYKEAVTHLDKFSSSDPILNALALGNIGDAFVALNQPKEAMDYYKKAIDESDNVLTAPIYLSKAAQVAQDQKNYKEALTYLERIKTDYPNSEEAASVDVQISQIEALTNL